jgi:hypothetical protein
LCFETLRDFLKDLPRIHLFGFFKGSVKDFHRCSHKGLRQGLH